MPRALITGASGFVGRHLVATLAGRGWETVTVSRRPMPATHPGQHPVVVDPSDADAWTALVDSVDYVVHLAARVHVMREEATDPLAEFRTINVELTRLVTQAAAASRSVRRFLLLSSIKVNGEATQERPFTERDTPAPADPYAISKLEAEQALATACADSSMEYCILRPPLVYGPGVGGNFRRLLEHLDRGWPLPLANVANRRSLLGVANLCDAIAFCLVAPAAADQILLVADGHDLSTPELARLLAEGLGRRARLFPLPLGLMGWLAEHGVMRREFERLTGSLQIDTDKLTRRLGWSPPYECQVQLRETVAWYREVTHPGGQP